MKTTTNQDRLNELFDKDPRNDTAIANALGVPIVTHPNTQVTIYRIAI